MRRSCTCTQQPIRRCARSFRGTCAQEKITQSPLRLERDAYCAPKFTKNPTPTPLSPALEFGEATAKLHISRYAYAAEELSAQGTPTRSA